MYVSKIKISWHLKCHR